ncbi:unnamed protein product [Somion occarium]
MELLKRFEEDSLEDTGLLDEDEQDQDDLIARFQNLNIESASYDEIWSALTPEERDNFLKALNEPSSELAQQLLASEELQKQKIDPWWEAPNEDTEEDSLERSLISLKKYGKRPTMVEIPDNIVSASAKSLNTGPSLLYNITAVLIAYAYITRSFATSPISSLAPQDSDSEEARRTISRLVPFLVDRKSTTVLPSVSALVTDLWSRFEPGTMTSTFFAILLNDASKLLRPSPVTVLPNDTTSSSPYESHTNANALRALSDLSSFFSSTKGDKPRPANVHITHKLTFYAARIISTPTNVLGMLADEVMLKAEAVKREGAQAETEKKPTRPIELTEAEKSQASGREKVEALSSIERGKRVVIEELT